MVWYSHLFENFPHFVVIHTVKGFGIVNEAEVDAFLEIPCFFYDPADVGNLISGSSTFLKSSLYIWKFLVHVLLKPGLKDFENYLQFSSVQSLSRVWLFATPWIAARQASLSITNSRSLLRSLLRESCPSSRWCHPAISSSIVPFSSCPQSLPASGSFPMNQLFAWGGQSTGVSASASVLPVNTQDWSPLG